MAWFSRLMSHRPPKSADVASERLQLVLKYDRARVPPGLITTLKDEILAVISRYLDVVEEGIEVTLSPSGNRQDAPVALVANVPIRGPRGPVPSRR